MNPHVVVSPAVLMVSLTQVVNEGVIGGSSIIMGAVDPSKGCIAGSCQDVESWDAAISVTAELTLLEGEEACNLEAPASFVLAINHGQGCALQAFQVKPKPATSGTQSGIEVHWNAEASAMYPKSDPNCLELNVVSPEPVATGSDSGTSPTDTTTSEGSDPNPTHATSDTKEPDPKSEDPSDSTSPTDGSVPAGDEQQPSDSTGATDDAVSDTSTGDSSGTNPQTEPESSGEETIPDDGGMSPAVPIVICIIVIGFCVIVWLWRRKRIRSHMQMGTFHSKVPIQNPYRDNPIEDPNTSSDGSFGVDSDGAEEVVDRDWMADRKANQRDRRAISSSPEGSSGDEGDLGLGTQRGSFQVKATRAIQILAATEDEIVV